MESSNARLVLGLALGLALGVAAGWLLRSAGERPAGVAPALSSGVESDHGSRLALEPPLPVASDVEARDERRVAPARSEQEITALLEPRIDELAASLERPTAGRAAGEGAISGRVLDESGTGLAGVVLRATRADPSARAIAPAGLGQGAPALQDFDLAVRDAARKVADTLARTYEATSDALGSYRFDRLPPGRYRIDAYKRDHELEPADGFVTEVPDGAELDFAARPLLRVPVRVALADGDVPPNAVLSCERKSGASQKSATYAWTAAEPELRLVPGAYELFALGGLIENGTPRQLDSELRSEPQTLELQLGAPIPELVFVLSARSGIRGRVTFAKDGVTGTTAQLHLLALGETGELELAQLASSDRSVYLRGDDDFAFLDLEPGRYALGVTRSNEGPVYADRIVDVEAAVVRCDLAVPPLDLSQYLSVRVESANGELLGDVNFQFLHKAGSGSSSRGSRAMRGPDGRHIVTIPDEGRAAYFARTEGHEFRLTAESGEHGSRDVALEAGQTELEVVFGAGATLEVLVAGLAGTEYTGRLRLALDVAGAEDTSLRFGRGEIDVNPDGSARFDGREVGAYELSMWLKPSAGASFGRRTLVLVQAVQLAAGSNTLRIALPPLYPVTVRWAGGADVANVQLRRRDADETDARARVGSLSARIGDDGYARFETVPAGAYTLSAWSESGTSVKKEIEVPCGEVELRPQ